MFFVKQCAYLGASTVTLQLRLVKRYVPNFAHFVVLWFEARLLLHKVDCIHESLMSRHLLTIR